MLAGLVLVAMLLLAAFLHRLGAWGAVAMVLLSLLWLRVNKDRLEGEILLTFSAHRGLTAGDLVGLAGIGLGGWRWRRPAGRVA
jgi:hypothetical protein